jgi:hypothetical protein
LVLIFDKYAIGPGSAGTPSFALPLDKVVNRRLEAAELVTQGDALLAPLAPLAEALGYTVTTNAASQGLVLKSGAETHTLAPGQTKIGQRDLSVAPVLKNGILYAPLEYFELALGASYLREGKAVTISKIVGL